MNALWQVLNTIGTYGSLILGDIAMAVGLLLSIIIAMVFEFPGTSAGVYFVILHMALWYAFKTYRRYMRWYLVWPVGRMWYKIVLRPVRYLSQVVMAKWKKEIVADRLDDALMKLCYDEKVLTKHQYRRLSSQLGKALGINDLVSKKLHPMSIRREVTANIESVKAGPKGSIPGPPQPSVDPSYDPKSGKTTQLAYLRGRNSVA